MRKLHTFENELPASRFTAVLTVNKIEAQVLRNSDDRWDLWIIDEDSIKSARGHLERFLNDPQAAEFEDAFAEAKKIHQQIKQEKAERIKRAKTIEVRTQFRDPRNMAIAMQRKNTFTRKVIMICAVVFGASLVFNNADDPNSQNNFVRNALEVLDLSRAKTGTEVNGEFVPYSRHELLFQHIAEGQVWRLITPVFVHGNSTGEAGDFLMAFIHIFFNMYWLYWLGTLMEVRFGLKTYLVLFFISAIASVLFPLLTPESGLLGLRGLQGGPVVGMSGVVYAVIGFGWCKMRLQPSVGMLVPPFVLMISMIWLIFGIVLSTGSEGVSHLAHLVGMVTGVGIAYVHTLMGK